MSKVLVTGATGCIGRFAVSLLLDRGWEVHTLSRSEPDVSLRHGATWHRVNLLDREETRLAIGQVGATHLLHLAWYIAPGKWASAPENFEWVDASFTLLRAFRDAGGVRFVAAGSCLEYDWRYGYCSEERTPCEPHTPYGACKHGLQLLTAAYAASSGLSSAWGRVFFLYGPGEHPDRLVASVIRALLAGQPALTSHGRQVRDYLYAEDVADAFVRLLESNVAGPINIGSGVPVTLKEIIQEVGSLLGRADLLRLGAIPAAPTDVPLVVADTARLTQRLGWQPRCNLDFGLRKTIEWWQAQAARNKGFRAGA